MTDTTSRLALPLLQPGQAQKELFHNEALIRLDAMLAAVAETIGDVTPPGSPTAGAAWILGAAPTGAWAGHALELAAWTDGGWRFAVMPEGALVWVRSATTYARRGPDGWLLGELPLARVTVGGAQVLGARQPAIPAPTGGTTPDAEGRAAITMILAALRNHGLIAT